MSLTIYKSNNGFWRGAVDDKVHPLLVGFENLIDLIKKAQEILPSMPSMIMGISPSQVYKSRDEDVSSHEINVAYTRLPMITEDGLLI